MMASIQIPVNLSDSTLQSRHFPGGSRKPEDIQAFRERVLVQPLQYWLDNPAKIPQPAKELLIQYAKVPPEQVIPHIIAIRDRALEVYCFPSIASLRFMNLSLSTRPIYTEIVRRVQEGQIWLDMGCCFGVETRKLVFDAGSEVEGRCFASDISPVYLALGYELFNDERLKSNGQYLLADTFKLDQDVDDHAKLRALKGTVDIIYASSFFHLFSWDTEVILGTIVVSLLKPQRGSLVVGRQAGSNVAGPRPDYRAVDGGQMYRHDPSSLQKLWDEVGEKTATKWSVEATLDETEISPESRKAESKIHNENDRRLLFAIRRQ